MDVRNMYVRVNEQIIDKPNNNNSVLPQLNISEPEQDKKVEASVNVSLSEEGKEKSKQEQEKDLFKALREKDPNAPATEEGSGDELSEKIKELKDKIATLLQELAAEKNKENGEERIKQIEAELNVLQAQLMSLLNEQLEGKQ